MYGVLLALHLVVCLALIGVVLVQSGKGGGLAGGAFGGTAQTVFGGRGATDFITRATMVLGATFFATSLILALLSSNAGRTRSLIQEQARRSAPVAPAPPQTRIPGAPATLPSGSAPGATLPAPAPAVGSAPAPAPAKGSAPAPAGPASPAPAGSGATKPPGGGN